MLPVLLTDTVTPDLARAVHYTLLWGLEGVVLRVVGGAERRVPDVDTTRIITRLRNAELPVVAVDPGLFEASPERRAVWMNDLAAFDETAALCVRLSCSLVIVGALAEPGEPWEMEAAAAVLRQAGEQAARRGLRLALRNDAATPCAGGATLADLLASTAHPAVVAAWSPADALAAGHDAATGLQALLDHAHIALVTVRDGVVEADTWHPRPLGEGTVGWEDHLATLAASGYEGALCLTLEGDQRAKAGLRDAAALVEGARAARRPAG